MVRLAPAALILCGLVNCMRLLKTIERASLIKGPGLLCPMALSWSNKLAFIRPFEQTTFAMCSVFIKLNTWRSGSFLILKSVYGSKVGFVKTMYLFKSLSNSNFPSFLRFGCTIDIFTCALVNMRYLNRGLKSYHECRSDTFHITQ